MSAVGAVGGVLAWPSDSGVAGSLIVSVVLGVPAYVRARVAARSRHREALGQAERHHAERMAGAAARQNELKHLAERHHQQQVARLEDHADAIKAHVTASLRPPAARRPAAPKAAP